MVHVGRIHRRTEPRAWALALVVQLVLLSGCSGTPLAERLSRSFPEATQPTAAELGAEPAATSRGNTKRSVAATAASAGAGPVASPAPAGRTDVGGVAPAGPPKGKPAGSADQAAASAVGSTASTAAAAGAGGKASSAALAPRSGTAPLPVPGNPAPYRVTLRLPRADPAAPAEVVTRALRAAGVPFEVETIERMPPAAAPGDARQPLPAPAATVR